jgi:hypothetical protein
MTAFWDTAPCSDVSGARTASIIIIIIVVLMMAVILKLYLLQSAFPFPNQ